MKNVFKEVFSVKRFEKVMKSKAAKKDIEFAKICWANKCDGLTAIEMLKLGLVTHKDWMIEIKE